MKLTTLPRWRLEQQLAEARRKTAATQKVLKQSQLLKESLKQQLIKRTMEDAHNG